MKKRRTPTSREISERLTGWELPFAGVRRMDRLVVLEHGRIVEQGPHDALLAQGGMYASLCEHQAGEFLALT